jgi:hypothetical protein
MLFLHLHDMGEIFYFHVNGRVGGKDCLVGIATCYGMVGPEIESWYGEILHADSKAYKVLTVSFPGVQQPKGYELYFHLPSVLT